MGGGMQVIIVFLDTSECPFNIHTYIHTYILAVDTAEPGVDVVLIPGEVILGRLYADVDGAGGVDDVPHMLSHVHGACGTPIVLPDRGEG